MIVNKNYPKYAALMLLFVFINPSFAMGGKVFQLTRIIGIGALPVLGLRDAYRSNKAIEKNSEESPSIAEVSIKEWGRKKMERLNFPNADSITFEYGPGWSVAGKKITVPDSERAVLDEALEFHKSYWSKIGFLQENRDEIIAWHSMLLNHEVGHVINKDSQNVPYVKVAIPVGIEALSFGMTKALRKVCNIEQKPKTFCTTILRSSFAVGAIVPKAFANLIVGILHRRYVETRADRFACEHAESRLELEQFAEFFKKGKIPKLASKSRLEVRLLEAMRDPMHPAPIDRLEMVESYIDKWDRDHAHEAEKRA